MLILTDFYNQTITKKMKRINLNRSYVVALLVGSGLMFSCGGDAKEESGEAAEAVTPVQENQPAAAEEVVAEPAPTDSSAQSEEQATEEPAAESTEAIAEKEVETPAPAPKVEAAKKEVAKVEEAKPVVEEEQKPAGQAKMQFEETEFAFGEIQQGDVVEHTFKYKNIGDAPLIISNARASCGCTVPKWTKEPTAPGANDEIHVKFNSRGKRGTQRKSITITTNYGSEVVYLKGVVKVPETPASGDKE